MSQPSPRLATKTDPATPTEPSSVPQLSLNGQPVPVPRPPPPPAMAPDKSTWGANFWVTLVDPQTAVPFFACPATGQVSWDPPIGTFVLPPSEEGEWWELGDDSRGGIPYYYQTKTGETVWERPDGFIIPLTIIQQTALGRRLSQTGIRMREFHNARLRGRTQSVADVDPPRPPRSSAVANSPTKSSPSPRRHDHGPSTIRATNGHLPPIPASPYPSAPSTPISNSPSLGNLHARKHVVPSDTEPCRSRSKSSSYLPHRPPVPQSLNAALEMLSKSEQRSKSDHGHHTVLDDVQHTVDVVLPPKARSEDHSLSPTRRHVFRIARNASTPSPSLLNGRTISSPVVNREAALDMSPVRDRGNAKPILVPPPVPPPPTTTLATGKTHPVLPRDLACDIQQFVESEYAKLYFSTHRTGFIFRRKVPVAQMMTWQRAPLASPLLTLNRSLKQDAVKIFKVVQHIMGDRERDRPAGIPVHNGSTSSLPITGSLGLLEEERWLISEGLAHGELRDEIYCQLMKQLTGNPNPESVFKGWQVLCVLLTVFPPSKNFETYLGSFIRQHTTHSEGRVDIMAKYCVRRLAAISKRGPRGKPPSVAEIETAADAAFNPSTFGESLDATMRLQERNYPSERIPIILPFLADGILALGGTKCEGIFRVPGDNDLVSDLKLRIDRGYYTLENVDDPHVLASSLKLWLRELCDPLVPEELYNDCITAAPDVSSCVALVRRLPTINRRVIVFIVSFLQLFLEEKVLANTKMTAANMALVMAPNLLRCSSESMTVVFTNAQFEQMFVYNLLVGLRCGEVDEDYTPVHGRGASPPTSPKPRISKSRNRR